ncbi:MAG TPA: BNR repeat-containing protein [Chitinophagaceae bacterium]|jgi:hypothetical protein|nr:BNR repeat-containing protein [Chitinophagaceae bacterium]
MIKRIVNNITVVAGLLIGFYIAACTSTKPVAGSNSAITLVNVDSGWAGNSINTTVFRKNSLVSNGNDQYIAFYNKDGYVMLGKRKLGISKWEITQSPYKGNIADAHNIISIMADDDGYLHIAWDHHNNKLHYARSKSPGSLQLSEQMPMTGKAENRISYPEFYKMPNGDLLFFYRDGGSGNGNLVINKYNLQSKAWTTLQSNLIDGEGKRNAYWQAFVDEKGNIHISWVWRESPDVASNHDLCYARSTDGGITWEKSTGEKYQLPITESTAEKAADIPQRSELINQTSMFADADGNPYIATYWREQNTSVPQYHLVFKKDGRWNTQDLGFRTTAFSLSGGGTKRIPIARPQIIAWQNDGRMAAAIIFRDEERGSKVSMAINYDITKNNWETKDLTTTSVGSWEPSYDTELWKSKKLLHLFIQKTEQADAEGRSALPPQMVQVLEWKPVLK